MFTHVAYVCCCRARCMPVWQLHCRYTWSLSTQRDRTFRSNVPCSVPGSWGLINTHTIHVRRYLQNIGTNCGMPIQCVRLYPCVRGTCAIFVCRHTLCLSVCFRALQSRHCAVRHNRLPHLRLYAMYCTPSTCRRSLIVTRVLCSSQSPVICTVLSSRRLLVTC